MEGGETVLGVYCLIEESVFNKKKLLLKGEMCIICVTCRNHR